VVVITDGEPTLTATHEPIVEFVVVGLRFEATELTDVNGAGHVAAEVDETYRELGETPLRPPVTFRR
jgi:hypothetical protein